MLVGIVDADLLGRKKHRFPNLVAEKISAYWKELGAEVILVDDLSYEIELLKYDEIYISKVFTDTTIPDWLERIHEDQRIFPNDKELQKYHFGGTGFFFDKAPNLPSAIEHHMPDYHLYDSFVQNKISEGYAKSQFKEYTDYSIGFITRGCFRKCKFCVNQKYDHVFPASPLSEFYDPSRKKICLLDDNFLGYPKWRECLEEIKDTNKPFKFKQGLDERLLNDEKCKLLFSSKYDGDYTFAFDDIRDYELIHSKLRLIRKYTDIKNIKFYVLVGFEGTDANDIENAFIRISLLQQYECLPYIMRFQNRNETPWKNSEYAGMYIALARWCNQPSFFKKMSFRQFCEANQERSHLDRYCSTMKAMVDFEKKHKEIADKYFDLKFGEI